MLVVSSLLTSSTSSSEDNLRRSSCLVTDGWGVSWTGPGKSPSVLITCQNNNNNDLDFIKNTGLKWFLLTDGEN